MTAYRADWLLPIVGPPIRGGWVAVNNGRISAVAGDRCPDAVDLGRAAILPALVNAHTHLELSHLRGAVPPSSSFLDWVRALIAVRRESSNPADPAVLAALRAAILEARACGTGLIGDISNTLASPPLLRDAEMPARVFLELLGFDTADPDSRVREARAAIARLDSGPLVGISLAPHAPHSVSPALLTAIRADLDTHAHDRSSVHLSESPEEVAFIEKGEGGWPHLLRELGVWSNAWAPHGGSPVKYLADLGFLDSRVLAVHAVHSSGDDLAHLRALGTTVVSCPRSNRHVGVGDPPLEAFFAMGVTVAFGTDSLASVGDLNMFAELAAARRLAPRVPARALLAGATLCGARALGFDEFGSIEEGKRAALIAVRLPEGADNVEELLVSGVEPGAISWLDATTSSAQPPAPRSSG